MLSVDTHLRHVKNSLLGAANQWRDIGQTLNLIPRTLRSIGRSHHDNDSECLNEVLAKWMHSGKATIDQLLEALEDPAVQRNDIAAEIRALKGDKRNRVGLPPDLEPEHSKQFTVPNLTNPIVLGISLGALINTTINVHQSSDLCSFCKLFESKYF